MDDAAGAARASVFPTSAAPWGRPWGSQYRRHRRLLWVAAVLLPLMILKQSTVVRKRGMDVATAVAYRLDPELRGRRHDAYPAPSCCRNVDCLTGGRVAVVTYVRNEGYFPLFQQLECTLRRSNPDLELAAMVVADELGEESLSRMQALNVTLLPVEPYDIENLYEPRFAKNWLKIRALQLTDYAAILLVDSDVAFLGKVSEVFDFPTPFAAVLDQPGWLNSEKTGVDMFQGGVLMLRPCEATAQHMMQLVESIPKLRFSHGNAEQEFFSWYFRHTAWTLPLEYNTMTHPSLEGNLTTGGVPPKVLHFTSNKPFNGPTEGSPGHQFLCSLEELEQRG